MSHRTLLYNNHRRKIKRGVEKYAEENTGSGMK
jgi:hypothetical protein